MFLESIAYTATLIHYVAQLTDRTVADATVNIGQYNLSRLCHNAPMNQLLPISRIAHEVIYDNDLYRHGSSDEGIPDFEYGNIIKERVKECAYGKQQYAAVLYDILVNV